MVAHLERRLSRIITGMSMVKDVAVGHPSVRPMISGFLLTAVLHYAAAEMLPHFYSTTKSSAVH